MADRAAANRARAFNIIEARQRYPLLCAAARTLLVDTQAMFPNNSKITQKYNPGTRSLADILQVEPSTPPRPAVATVAELHAIEGFTAGLVHSFEFFSATPSTPPEVASEAEATQGPTCNSLPSIH